MRFSKVPTGTGNGLGWHLVGHDSLASVAMSFFALTYHQTPLQSQLLTPSKKKEFLSNRHHSLTHQRLLIIVLSVILFLLHSHTLQIYKSTILPYTPGQCVQPFTHLPCSHCSNQQMAFIGKCSKKKTFGSFMPLGMQ